MQKTGNLFVFLAGLLLSFSVAANVNVQATVDSTEVGLGDSLTFSIVVSSTESVDVEEPHIQQLAGFDIMNSWNASSTSSKLMQTSAGMKFETVRQSQFYYSLMPKSKGTLIIPGIEVNVEGQRYNTQPIRIQVSDRGRGQPRGGGQAPRGGFPQQNNEDDPMAEAEEMFNQLLQRRGIPNQLGQGGAPGGGGGGFRGDPNLAPKNANEALSVVVEVDKREVYEGEQIVANWYIFTRGNLMSLDRVKFPDLKGFWKEIIEEVPSLNFTQEVINGVPYRKALLASHALFPIKTGSAVIDEYKVKGQVQVPNSPFSSFGMGPAYSFQRASERIKVTVKPLPLEGKPGDFSGAVGNFDVRAQVEGEKFPANQPFTLKVRFEGEGNAKLIELPNLNLPAGVELYNSKSESKYFKNGRSYKEFEVLLIPRQEGPLEIPALQFSMFDPQSKSYVTKKTNAISIQIGAAVEGAKGQDARLDVEKATPEVKKQLPSLILQANRGAGGGLLSGFWLWGVLYSLITLALGWKGYREFGRAKADRDLKPIIAKRMKVIQAAVSKGDYRAVGTQMTNLIYFVLGQVSGDGGAGLDISKILNHAPPSLRREIGDELSKLIDMFQILGFAPDNVIGSLKSKEELQKNTAWGEKLLIKAVEISEQKEEV